MNLGGKVTTNTNYLRLDNKPSVNGVQLIGNKTARELSVLSNDSDTYDQVSIRSANKADFLLLLNNQKNTKKLQLKEISSRMVQTSSEIPDDLEVGNYVFLLKEDK
ncbi:MAG: hypothetical protein IJ371_04210 [Clostridia bacterium]|nr:hypothetical protein [Clostridia bacterium]